MNPRIKVQTLILPLLLLLIIMAWGCGGGGNPGSEQQRQRQMPAAITDMEKGLQEIMLQADLIPVVEQLAAGEPTFEETILGEVLAREMEQDLSERQQEFPKEREEIWDIIKNAVTELYDLWNDLEPQLIQENVSRDEMNLFEQNLDKLTVLSTGQDRFGVMTAANQLTGCLSQFMIPFAQHPAPLAYELKFHLRELVLKAAKDDYQGAAVSMDYIKEQGTILAKALNEKYAGGLDTSIGDLQRALDKQNLDLIRVNAAVLMENLVAAIRQLP